MGSKSYITASVKFNGVCFEDVELVVNNAGVSEEGVEVVTLDDSDLDDLITRLTSIRNKKFGYL